MHALDFLYTSSAFLIACTGQPKVVGWGSVSSPFHRWGTWDWRFKMVTKDMAPKWQVWDFTWSLGFQILCILHEASPFYGSMCNFNMVSIVVSQLARFSESSPALSSKADPSTPLPRGNVCAPLLRQASEDLSRPHCHVPPDYPVFWFLSGC